jgi:two-component system, chemotaxis family, protein-glutamate methylesterase/glutaminase
VTLHQPKMGISPRKTQAPIRVMLVDDSIVARSILERILSQREDIKIVHQAEDTETALKMLKQQDVDIILLDIEMPQRNGLDALPEFIEQAKGARILIVSSFAEENGPAAIQALSLGACDTLAKPGRTNFTGQFSATLVDKVVRLGKSRKKHNSLLARKTPIVAKISTKKPQCIAIGASTGGIPAIYEIIRNLNATVVCPVFITQHLPDAFMTFFARQLAAQTQRKVVVAEHGMQVENNYIYIAPGLAHLGCKKIGSKVQIAFLENYIQSRYCPSVDAMFESLSGVYGTFAVGIILSGMGNDGAHGARMLSSANATVIIQDSESSVIWGMPGAVARENLAAAILNPTEIADLLNEMGSGKLK